jgi:hypothetical protein
MKTRFVVLAAVVVAGAGFVGLLIKDRYFDDVTIQNVPIVNAPCRDGRLSTPLVIQTDESTIQYTGGPVSVALAPDETHELHVRIGSCQRNGAGWDCRRPQWLGGEQIVSVDTRNPSATIVLGFPGEHACS